MDVGSHSLDATSPLSEPVSVSRRIPNTQEAPDRGDEELEAPETRVDRPAEAPDAGEAPSQVWENEFTHGRSQS
jgi:hypothetical protein